jgi:hypothetical protein
MRTDGDSECPYRRPAEPVLRELLRDQLKLDVERFASDLRKGVGAARAMFAQT